MSFINFLKSKTFFKHLLIMIVIIFILSWIATMMLDIYSDHGESIETPDFKGLSIKEAEIRATQSNLIVQVIDSFYKSSKFIGLIIEQTPKPKFKLKKERTIFLTINSTKPDKIKMPDLLGSTYRQAIAIIESYGCNVGNITYVKDETNTVLAQKYKRKTIQPGELIDKGSRIDLVVGKGRNNKKDDEEEEAQNEK